MVCVSAAHSRSAPAESPVRAATALALWAAARAGGHPGDDVVRGIDGSGYRAGVRAVTAELATRTGLPGPGERSAATAALLALAGRGGVPELLLPVAGDLRGLPPRGAVTVPALDAGAVVVFPRLAVGIVPQDGQWRVHDCPGGVPVLSLGEAGQLIDEAIRTATADLMRVDIARGAERVRDRVRELMLDASIDTPAALPRQASALLAKVISLEALLDVAAGHETAAVTSGELAVVDDALRPLRRAVREGRRSAVTAAASTLAASVPPTNPSARPTMSGERF